MIGTVLISGATAGLGAVAARRFAKAGWQVIGTGRRADRLESLKAELGNRFHGMAFDITDESAMTAARDALPEQFRNIDVLVNNAGLALGAEPVPNTSLVEWRKMIDTNVTGLVTLTHHLLPNLIERRGIIINVASVAASWPYPGGNVYGATKAFVRQFSLNLRADLHGKGVRVTSLEPGLCESEFTLVRTGGDKAAHDALYAGANPLQPDDIAETMFWIATQPSHVNINTLAIMPVSQSFAGLRIHRDA